MCVCFLVSCRDLAAVSPLFSCTAHYFRDLKDKEIKVRLLTVMLDNGAQALVNKNVFQFGIAGCFDLELANMIRIVSDCATKL